MDYDTPSFLFLHILFIGFFSSDFADFALRPLANAVAFLL